MTFFRANDPDVQDLVRELKHINRWLLILISLNVLDLAIVLVTVVAANAHGLVAL